jgi:hypothetical protein
MPPPEPHLWRTFATFFGLSEAARAQWWTALNQAQTPKPVAWVRQLLFYDARPSWNHAPDAEQAYILRSMAPTVVVDALEALVEEGLLSRQRGSALQDAVLTCVNRDGQWIT